MLSRLALGNRDAVEDRSLTATIVPVISSINSSSDWELTFGTPRRQGFGFLSEALSKSEPSAAFDSFLIGRHPLAHPVSDFQLNEPYP